MDGISIRAVRRKLPSSKSNDIVPPFEPAINGEFQSFWVKGKPDEIQLDKQTQDINQPVKVSKQDTSKALVNDPNKRVFLKLAAMAGVGALVAAFFPNRAEALILGSSPTTGVVGVKDATDTRISPATEGTLQDLLTGQSVDKITTQLAASGNVLVPGAGNRIRVYSTRFSLTADLTSVGFRFTSGGTDYERYISPKAGGLYGANNHPNYVEGGVDQALYCAITGTATVQINVDYLEV